MCSSGFLDFLQGTAEVAEIAAATVATVATVKAITSDSPGGAFGPAPALPALPTLPEQPVLPEPTLIKDEAREEAKKRLRARRAATGILTAPTGLLVEPNIGRKTLLGE